MDERRHESIADRKKKIYTALAISAALLALVLVQTQAFNNAAIGEELFKDLCDSFFTVGILFVFYGTLAMAAKNGTFNFFSYNGRMLSSFFVPSLREEKRGPYHEYVLQMEEKRKSWRMGYVFIIGAAYCAVGFIFLALYTYYPY